jgi:ureidoglycolate lyase
MRHSLSIEPLTRQAFAPFGDVIAKTDAPSRTINAGYAERFDPPVRVDTAREGGRTGISLAYAKARVLPMRLELMERHPLGSQVFMPLQPTPFLVAVAAAGTRPSRETIHVFRTRPGNGINYAPDVWHHPLIALADMDFLVVDRAGPGGNLHECDVRDLDLWIDA